MRNTINKLLLLISGSFLLAGCGGTSTSTQSGTTTGGEVTTTVDPTTTSGKTTTTTVPPVGHTISIEGDFDPDEPYVFAGTSLQLQAYVDEEESTKVTWSVDDQSIAGVTSKGLVSFFNTLEEDYVTVKAASKDFPGLEATQVFYLKPCVVNLENSTPNGIEYNEEGTQFSVPKEKSSLIYNGVNSTSFYVEATIKVKEKTTDTTRIGLMTGTSEYGCSLDYNNPSLYFYIHIDKDSQAKTVSQYVGIAKSNSNYSDWEVVKIIDTGAPFYKKGQDFTIGLLRKGQEYIFFTVNGGVKTALARYEYKQIDATVGSYAWIGTSKGENTSGDNGEIAYDAKNLNILLGTQSDALYEEYKNTPLIGGLPVTVTSTEYNPRIHVEKLEGGYDYVVKYEGTLQSPSSDWGHTLICEVYEDGVATVNQGGFSFRGDWCGDGKWVNNTYFHAARLGDPQAYPQIKTNCSFTVTYVFNDTCDYIECMVDYVGNGGATLQSYQKVSKVTYSGGIDAAIGLTYSSVAQTLTVNKFTVVSKTPVQTKPTAPELPISQSTTSWNSTMVTATMDVGGFEVFFEGHATMPAERDQHGTYLGNMVAEIYSPHWCAGGVTATSDWAGWGPWCDGGKRTADTNPTDTSSYLQMKKDCDFQVTYKFEDGVADITFVLTHNDDTFRIHHKIIDITYNGIMVISLGLTDTPIESSITIDSFFVNSGNFLY